MSSEELGLNSPQLVFHQDEALRFGAPPQRRVGDSGPTKTRELSGFIDDRFFPPQNADFRRGLYSENPERRDPPEPRNWNPNATAVRTPSGEGSDDDEDEDDDDDDVEDDDDDGDVGGLFGVENRSKGNGGNNVSNGEDKMGNGNVKHQQLHSSFGGALILGSSREVLEKDHSVSVGQQTLNNNSIRDSPSNNHHDHLPGRVGSYQNAITVAESSDGDMYYSQYLQGSEGSGAAQKDLVVENGCGFSGRKDALCSSESGDPLRAILSDPVTGALMDDAMILPCGHSFGGGGVQQVIRMKACFTCSQSISEDSIAPNLSLRSAVQAFRREEELHFHRSSKRKRERFDQDKGGYGDLALTDPPRGRGVQFPFAVMDRVIIKGNKRTPQRFVGREAVVTTQCLNGWYVVKTLDNAESVKLQYRSLAKVPDDSSSKAMPSKMAPNWL
ncbi:U-box domain-containing protein 62-like [Rosa rugosa]|uniref:U-box domain-containing protein 62-like n=1 Tax=Rosa rugosa TaxID=74645 RepID=UPI002B4027B1|nr:U-box domain-containing protein 62-like [Rosa rugosa]